MTMTPSERVKQHRLKRRAEGLCDRCGKPTEDSAFRCNECGIKHRIRMRERQGCNPTMDESRCKYHGEELVLKSYRVTRYVEESITVVAQTIAEALKTAETSTDDYSRHVIKVRARKILPQIEENDK